jgi:transposase
LVKAYRDAGPRGIIHGNRGRRPAHAVDEEQRDQLITLAQGAYAGVNHSHLAELLAEREHLQFSRSTLSRILNGAGIRSPRPQKRRSKHRSRRERYPQEGMLVQLDASHHAWLEERGPRFVLMAAIDDATGTVVAARFHPSEEAKGYFLLMREICRRTGVPQALYSDKHAIFWPTNGESLKEQLAGRPSPTQFGRAMAELGIQMIPSHSPQSRGRIERLWGTLQDRLVAELRLAGITTMEQSNAYLPGFLRRFNRGFTVSPAVPGSAYRPRLKAADLDTVLCFKHERVVANDNTVGVDGILLQLLPGPNRLGYAKAIVAVHESLDARFSVFFQECFVASKIIPLRKRLSPKPAPRHPPPPSPARTEPAPPPPPKPAPDHPWRRYPAVTKSLNT